MRLGIEPLQLVSRARMNRKLLSTPRVRLEVTPRNGYCRLIRDCPVVKLRPVP